MSGQVFWITGFSGAGKTTVGTRLYYRLKKTYPQIVLLDGDIIQRIFGAENIDYSKEGRKKRAFQYSELCKLLSSQGITVICCAIAMFDDVRIWNRQNIANYHEIFIDVDLKTLAERDVKGLYKKFRSGKDAMVGVEDYAELPKNPDVVIRNSMANSDIERYVDEISLRTTKKRDFGINYWNEYYKSDNAPRQPSDFAEFSVKYMKPDKKLIDLGCGNGRDSIYFCVNGSKVTAVDSSINAIESIDKSLPIFAVCDDFVTAKALFCVDYDYCYARWSIHSISQPQQNELFQNVYKALKEGGLFFIEARTVNDSKYVQGEKLGINEYFFDDHYRRFIDPDLFKTQLETTGFEIIYIEESDGFSVVNDNTPALVRIVAEKHHCDLIADSVCEKEV